MYELIAHQKLDSSASAITFSNIPQIYTDVHVAVSARSTNADDNLYFKFNNTTSNTSWRNLLGYGTGVLSQSGTGWLAGGGVRSNVSNTFTNISIYVPNYAGSAVKSASVDSTSEETGSNGYQFLTASLWNDTTAINRIDLYLQGGQLAAGSSATLYGINRTSAIGKPKAIGGNITYANGYWVHTFTGSGTFYANEALTADVLVVSGGGGGGDVGGGGGAGGYQITSGMYVTKGATLPAIIGSGGSAAGTGSNGSTSRFSVLTAPLGGGGGGGYQTAGLAGGSGGGGGSFNGAAGGAGTSGQGNNGGAGSSNSLSAQRGAGGGGGGGSTGSSGVNNGTGGAGGAGILWNGAYYAGGGGGEGFYTGGAGGVGGGGTGGINASAATAGTANTGGGGGGSQLYTGNGGSGVVIVRYRAD